ncbi:hypothetical protein FKZ61_007450 [Litorilinea aerophila]|nr:molybdopterin-binding protein [Litorilinea aerophila]MCC9075943.1 hypothetical protein [Litorilinea aerophila]
MRAIRAGILFVPEIDDQASQAVRALLHQAVPHLFIVAETSAANQRYWLEDLLQRWCDEEEMDLILTIGGTLPAPGPSSREVVPDATAAVLERDLPGLAEAMRAHAAPDVPLAWLHRGRVGIRGRTLILNLPGGAGAAARCLEGVAKLLAPTLDYLWDESPAPRLPSSSADVPTSARRKGRADRQSSGLDPAEFAAFLKRSGRKDDDPAG